MMPPIDGRGEFFDDHEDAGGIPDYEAPDVETRVLLEARAGDFPMALEFNMDARAHCLTYDPANVGAFLELPDWERLDWRGAPGVRVWILDAHLEAFAEAVQQLVEKARAMHFLPNEHADA